MQSVTCVSIDINSHTAEDVGACPFFLLFSRGIKFKLLIQLRDLGSHIAALSGTKYNEIKKATVKKQTVKISEKQLGQFTLS